MIMKYLKISTFVFMFIALVTATGCSNNTPVYSDVSEGGGYKIRLMASANEVTNGGSFSVTAYVTDPDGNAVPDEDEAVIFSSNASDIDFDDKKADIKSGIAMTYASWEDKSDSDSPDPPTLARIMGVYKGASSYVEVLLISESF